MTATVNDKHTVLPPTDLEEMLDVGRFLDGLTQPAALVGPCLLYTSPSPRDVEESRMPSSA